MGSKTGIIKFNVTQRGRKFRGQDRNFDTVALANLINGPEVQEMVKHRDMHGYFGHWPRVKFGMRPIEGGVLDGRHVSLEPALVTTMLKAHPDGTIEHEAEFLDTASGRIAERMYRSKTGGFSSAIDVKRVGGKQMPTGFYGFDFVMEPNFTKNRGYELALDGVEDEAMLDAVATMAEYQSMFDAVNRMFDDLQAAYDRQAETLAAMELENEQMRSMLVRNGQIEKGEQIALDGVREVVVGTMDSRLHRADDFLQAPVHGFQQPKKEDKPRTAADDYIDRHYG